MENKIINIFENNNMQNITLSLEEIKYNKKIKHLKNRRRVKFYIDRNMKDINILLNIIWIIILGIFSSFIFGLIGTFYFLTIVGVPFGIVLYRTIPLIFSPINKRVVLDFKSLWFLNIIWLLSGGFFFAMFFELISLICYITVIGIPIGRQAKKIATLFWAPFGSEIVEFDEFTDDEKEKQAYTLQYIRKNRINIDFEKLNVDDKTKRRIEKLTDYKYPFVYTIFRGSYSTIITAFLIVLYFIGLVFLLNKIGFFDSKLYTETINLIKYIPSIIHNIIFFLFSPMIKLFGFLFSLININIYKFVDIIIDIYVSLIVLWLIFELIKLIFVIVVLFVLLSVNRNKIYTYGYATRIELIRLYDSKYIVTRKNADLIYILYKLYEKEIDEEIIKDVPVRKKQCE